MISTQKLNEYFTDYVSYEPFTIQTAHATTKHDFVINIPSLKTFNAVGQTLKFHVFDFSQKYDGLIGVNLMKQLGAVIDVPGEVLKTKFGNIKIFWENSKLILGPRERKIVKIPITKNFTNVLINHQQVAPGVEIPYSLTQAQDFHAITEAINFNNYPVELDNQKPIQVEPYQSISQPKSNNTKTSLNPRQIEQIQYKNVRDKLRLNHLNDEEKYLINKLCTEYKDICYSELLPLTFTNSVKHTLNLKDETPIYMKPYRKTPEQRTEIKEQDENQEQLLQDIQEFLDEESRQETTEENNETSGNVDLISTAHSNENEEPKNNETLKQLQRKYYWLNMKETVSAFIKRCEMCYKPFQKIHMDTFIIGGKIYLTCMDAFTKFAQAIHINSKNAVELVDAMITYFSMYGNKTTPKYTGPYEVKQVNQDNTAVVTDKNQKEKKVHIRNLKYGIVPDSLPESEDQPGTSR
ncbi:Integrase zinc binding domain [Popillia japonica]|uniref:Integrase zinc binding domain n=2 Tax=Popillia japonica TaxID=7064 RepID=A0AAW1HWK7_POPJA